MTHAAHPLELKIMNHFHPMERGIEDHYEAIHWGIPEFENCMESADKWWLEEEDRLENLEKKFKICLLRLAKKFGLNIYFFESEISEKWGDNQVKRGHPRIHLTGRIAVDPGQNDLAHELIFEAQQYLLLTEGEHNRLQVKFVLI